MIYNFSDKEPDIAGDVFTAPGSRIIGDVIIKAKASIWYNTVIRGDYDNIYIGKYSNIQENCSLHVDINLPLYIGDYVTVGHSAVLHGCTVEDYCLIGMGATVLDRSKIGKHSIVGAGTLITEDKIIPEKSLVLGVPGRVVRTLTDEEITELKKSAIHYHTLAKKHKKSIEETN